MMASSTITPCAELMSAPRQRGRRRRRLQCDDTSTPRSLHSPWRWLCALAVLASTTTTTTSAGRVEVSWTPSSTETGGTVAVDREGDVVVAACATDTTFYVAKYRGTTGERVWRVEFGGHDDVNHKSLCAIALATDPITNGIYVTGSSTSPFNDDIDVFISALSDTGELRWFRTRGTPFQDVATSIQVTDTHVYIAGYSGGSMAAGDSSVSNCRRGGSAVSCDDGFVAKVAMVDGEFEWIHDVSSTVAGGHRDGESRVFGVAVETNAVFVVGETFGNGLGLDDHAVLLSNQSVRHAGDVFVHRLDDQASGSPVWRSQIGSRSGAEVCRVSSASSSSYYPQGRCGIVVDPMTAELFITGTTNAMVTSSASQRQQYETVGCTRRVVGRECIQLFAARVRVDSGDVDWTRQFVSKAQSVAEGLVLDRHGAIVLGTAAAGFFSIAESMEQLTVARVTRDGDVDWMAELGKAGEDQASAIAINSQQKTLIVMGHGTTDASRRGQPSTIVYLDQLVVATGVWTPWCVDAVAFDPDDAVATITRDPTTHQATFVQVRVHRVRQPMCADAPASVSYRAWFSTSPRETVGLVYFDTAQTIATVGIPVPVNTAHGATLHVQLLASSVDTLADSSASQWSVALANSTTVSGTVAADGHVWHTISWLALVGTVAMTLLVMVCGRQCRQRSGWAWRRAKIFEYKTLRMPRRPTASPHAATDTRLVGSGGNGNGRGEDTHAEDDEEESVELQSHLEEMQALNQSLDGLLQHYSSGRSMPRPPVPANASPMARTKSSKQLPWKRSLRSLLTSHKRTPRSKKSDAT